MHTLLSLWLALTSLLAQELPHAWPRDGARPLVENDRVAVWDVTWIKGKPSPMHRHRYDLVAVYLVGSPIRITTPDGQSRESSVDPGFVLFQAKGVTHIEEGLVEDNPRHSIMIDLKDFKAPPIPNTTSSPPAFPRDGARKVLENERVVIWDYAWQAGKPTPVHFHDKDVVVVFMQDGQLRSTTPDGQSSVTTVSRGLARFNAGNRTHSEALVSGAPRAIITELK